MIRCEWVVGFFLSLFLCNMVWLIWDACFRPLRRVSPSDATPSGSNKAINAAAFNAQQAARATQRIFLWPR